MAMAGEWDRYALQHKGLRVSTLPSGEQRSSHLLQLPYRLIIPIMTLSGVMHWAASQSIFLVDVVYQPAQGFDSPRYRLIAGDGRTSTTCGYSPLAILVFICLGLVMVLLLVAMSLRRLRTGMPVAGNCSAAISAACHFSVGAAPGISRMRLKWGEIPGQENFGEVDSGHDWNIGRRCAFSPGEALPPTAGAMYTN